MVYDNINDDERDTTSRRSLEYINRIFAELGPNDERNSLIRHLSREITTLIEYRERMNNARAILSAGKPQAARLALMALDGASIDQIMQEATATDQAR